MGVFTTSASGKVSGPPQHLSLSIGRKIFSVICIVIAHLLLAFHLLNLCLHLQIGWIPLVISILMGVLGADFVTGCIHWLADSYGSTNMPFLGKRIIHSFRVHHINPADFLRRTFVDTNGDTCLLVALGLGAMFFLPLTSPVNQMLAVGLIAFLGVSIYSNQMHKWAHIREPHVVIRTLQRTGLLLSNRTHARHHTHPHTGDYCVAPGWCNPVLERLKFFRRAEWVIAKCTGIEARAEEGAMLDAFRRKSEDQNQSS